MIELRPVTMENFHAVLRLSVRADQKHFVAENCYSIAQAYVDLSCRPFAAYDGDTLVGFCMWALDLDEGEYSIYRLMVDQNFQRKGYGRQILQCALRAIQADPFHHVCLISFEPDNDAAKALYLSEGFLPTGRIVDNELLYSLKY